MQVWLADRQDLRAVDTNREPPRWETITPEKQAMITCELAGLPTAYQKDEPSEEAKRFNYAAKGLGDCRFQSRARCIPRPCRSC